MGCGASVNDPEALARHRAIEKTLSNDRKELAKEIKLLLLGAGESGKSTFVKQMKIIHMDGFNEKEMRRYQSVIWDNILSCLVTLIRGAEKFGFDISDIEKEVEQILEAEDEEVEELLSLTEAVKTIWHNDSIQKMYSKRSKIQLLDSCKYYLDKSDTILQQDYVPSEADILRSRSRTTGIKEIQFKLQDFCFRLVDVGGQRSERKKWIHCFEDVTSVIFTVALSAYDLTLDEDGKTNRMIESLRLFRVVCSEYFEQIPVILFLNKRDLFEEKVKRVNINVAFRDYSGGKDYEEALEYIKNQFLQQSPGKEIFARATCALNTENIRLVFDAIKAIMLKSQMELF